MSLKKVHDNPPNDFKFTDENFILNNKEGYYL